MRKLRHTLMQLGSRHGLCAVHAHGDTSPPTVILAELTGSGVIFLCLKIITATDEIDDLRRPHADSPRKI